MRYTRLLPLAKKHCGLFDRVVFDPYQLSKKQSMLQLPLKGKRQT